MGRIILGIIIMAIGAIIVLKAEWILRNMGAIAFFEQHLGTEGGSRLGYKLIGIVVFLAGLLIMTGMIGAFLMWILGPLLKFGAPPV